MVNPKHHECDTDTGEHVLSCNHVVQTAPLTVCSANCKSHGKRRPFAFSRAVAKHPLRDVIVCQTCVENETKQKAIDALSSSLSWYDAKLFKMSMNEFTNKMAKEHMKGWETRSLTKFHEMVHQGAVESMPVGVVEDEGKMVVRKKGKFNVEHDEVEPF